MPYRHIDTLTRWVDEFVSQRSCGDLFKVIPHDGFDGAGAGLIVIPIHGDTTTAYIEPSSVGEDRWHVHFEPREREAVMSSADVHSMAAELQLAADLCDFIEQKSAEHLAALADA